MGMTRDEIKKAMRDTKKEVVLKNLHKLLSLVEGYSEYEDCVGYAIETLEQESKTGHWTDDGYCSCCNKQTLPLDISGYASGYDNFCPNCGTKMVES